MSDPPDPRDTQIAALEAALQLPLPETTLAQLAQDLRALRESAAPMITAPHAERDVNIATQQSITYLSTIIYGPDPSAGQREQLTRYLRRLVAKMQRLPLHGLAARLDEGVGIPLVKVYVMLATESVVEVARGQTRQLWRYYQDGKLSQSLKPEYTPDHALPTQAIVRAESLNELRREESFLPLALSRSILATEALSQHQHLILLGAPGGGKSTFLRHLAWALALRGLDNLSNDTALFGWDDTARLLPLLLPLHKLAGRIVAEGAEPATVSAALRDELAREYDVRQADELLDQVLASGAALLLFDGLDEVPLEGAPGRRSDRHTVLHVVRDFMQLYPHARAALTCRSRAFDESLRAELGWHVETLAPFTLGQIRHFIPAWYGELVAVGQLTSEKAPQIGQKLIDAITDPRRVQLRAMAENPLLLTLMALVLYNQGELPRDRPQLYERVLDLLLGQWDKVRDGQSLAEHLDLPSLNGERLRPLLDQLSYAAYINAASIGERGCLERGTVRDALITFFEREHPQRAWDLAQRCLDYIEQRSGLLVPHMSDTYVFAHLTLQEHCAGRSMLLSRDATMLVMRHRADDRWREPILLGMGVVQQTNPWLIESVLRKLIDREEDDHLKPVERWQRDLILAAEIGKDRDWAYLRDLRVDVGPLQRDLRRGLVALLQDQEQPLGAADRVHAGFLLGDLGDPRFPVTLDDWRRELGHVELDEMASYLRRVEAGTYVIGSADDDPDAEDDEKPQHSVTFDMPFWIARYPITNAQWLVWVEQTGGQPSFFADDANLNRLNQPVVGVTWYMCNDFCAWLSEQLGVIVRLPTEQEWEAAARGTDTHRFPWGQDWQEDRAATEEDGETRGRQRSVPVGCYLAGAAACGALDMAGNVWEWTASEWRSYPGAKNPFTEEDHRVLRGGGWESGRRRVRCGVRDWCLPVNNFRGGFRVVVVLRLAQ